MNGGIVQQRIEYGYQKCAEKIGAPFLVYRSTNPINPIQQNNLIGILPCSANVTWDYMTNQKYGKAVWNLIINTRTLSNLYAKPGDYLYPVPGYYLDNGGYNQFSDFAYNVVGSYASFGADAGFVEDDTVYFVASTEFLLPTLGVECNAVIDIIRPTQIIGAGYEGYSEYLPDTSEIIMTQMPASILMMGSSGMAPMPVPTDTKQPRWIILIPNLGGVNVRVGDIVIDNINQNYVVINNEESYLGWRIVAEQVVNSR